MLNSNLSVRSLENVTTRLHTLVDSEHIRRPGHRREPLFSNHFTVFLEVPCNEDAWWSFFFFLQTSAIYWITTAESRKVGQLIKRATQRTRTYAESQANTEGGNVKGWAKSFFVVGYWTCENSPQHVWWARLFAQPLTFPPSLFAWLLAYVRVRCVALLINCPTFLDSAVFIQ